MPARFRVLITDRAWPDCRIEREILAAVNAEVVEAPATDEATLAEFAADCDAILTCWANVSPGVIAAATRCRAICRFGIGLDNICVQTATERGIPVTYVPDYCIEEVADHTLALMLTLARNTAFFHFQGKRGVYDRQAGPPLKRLSKQVLGLVGFGRIGQLVHKKATAVGLTVVAHSASGNDYGTGCRMVDFAELLDTSDYVSLHLPLTAATHRLLAEPEFRRMKSTAYLLNTSRGGLIDHNALWKALQGNQLAGAALDVFDPEPPDLSQPLFQDERVIVTPHVAFLSAESVDELRTRTARQAADLLQNRRPEHLVNPEVWSSSPRP